MELTKEQIEHAKDGNCPQCNDEDSQECTNLAPPQDGVWYWRCKACGCEYGLSIQVVDVWIDKAGILTNNNRRDNDSQ
jgi:transcription elongation factor Elf1